MSKLGKILLLFSGVSLASFGVVRFLVGEFIPFLWIPIVLFPVFFVAAVFVDRALYKEFFFMKTTKQGMSMGAMIVMVLCALIALNFIAVRKYKVFDFSASKINSLSDQSIKLLKNMDSDLSVKFFYKKGQEGVEETRRAFRELIKKYQDESSLVKLEFVEVNERPDLAEQYGVSKGAGVVYVEYKGRKSKIEKIDEQELTGALIKVTREKDKIVYFITGHGEIDIEDGQDAAGGNLLKTLLEGSRYQVKTLSLLSTAKIPDDADMVFVIGPSQSYLENEVKILEDYLKLGGSLVLAIDPGKDHKLDSLLLKTGVVLRGNYVVAVFDTIMGKAIDPTKTPATEFSLNHPITKVFGKNQFVLFRLPQSVSKSASLSSAITYEDIIKTSDKSLGFSNTNFQGSNEKGPFTIAASLKGKLESSEKEFNMVVIGNSQMFSNQLLYQNLNRDLALNMVAYLAKEENLISITPKEVQVTQLSMTPTQFYVFVFGFIIPLPILLMIASGTLWYRRRNA